jgi:hypothetical protein
MAVAVEDMAAVGIHGVLLRVLQAVDDGAIRAEVAVVEAVVQAVDLVVDKDHHMDKVLWAEMVKSTFHSF